MEANELKLQVTTAPWFLVLVEQLAIAQRNARDKGVPNEIVDKSVYAAIKAIVSDAVFISPAGQGG